MIRRLIQGALIVALCVPQLGAVLPRRAPAPASGPDCDGSEIPVTTGLELAYIGCDSNVSGSVWTDQSGNLNDATGSGTGLSYVNEATSTITDNCGHWVMDNTADDQVFDFTGISITSTASILVLFQIDDDAVSANLNVTNCTGGVGGCVKMIYDEVNNEVIWARIFGDSTVVVARPTGTVLIAGRYQDDLTNGLNIHLDGSFVQEATETAAGTRSVDQIGHATESARMRLVALMFYNTYLSDADLNSMEAYMLSGGALGCIN